ncbi:MAG: DUF59 domain-containing protein [Bacteroidales bacterium]|nr:DUF59 domain-containing protein [Bacteroidales bacterium]
MKSKDTLREEIIEELKKIYDPEIPVSIWDLGLIYDIDISEKYEVLITMTLTSPNCPVAESMPLDVKHAIEKIPELKEVKVKVTFSPPWDMSKLSEAAMLELGFL